MFFQYSPECDSVRKFLGLLSGHLYRGVGEYPAFGTGDDTDKRLGELALYALVCNWNAGVCVALCVFPDQACPDAAENASLRNRLAGRVLWGVVLFCVVFVCIYGDYYDWLDSARIRAALVTAVVLIQVSINRMHRVSRPYISPEVFGYRHFPTILVLFLALCLFLTTASVLQERFMNRS